MFFFDRISRQNETLLNAQRTVAETEEIGVEITRNLADNRAKIESAHGKVREFMGLTDSAHNILKSMANREVQQKFIIGFIAVVLIIAIVLTGVYATKK